MSGRRMMLLSTLVAAGTTAVALTAVTNVVPASGATPTPTPTETPLGPCPPGSPAAYFVVIGGPTVTSGSYNPVDLSVRRGSFGSGNVQVLAAPSDTSTVTTLYDGPIDSDGRVDIDYSPVVNTAVTMKAQGEPPRQCGGYVSATATENVFAKSAVQISEAPERVAPRTFVFRGSHSGHGSDLINLYREDRYGRPVFTASTTSDDNGNYSIRRTFTGTGSFVFYTSTPSDRINAGGVSNRVRVTIS